MRVLIRGMTNIGRRPNNNNNVQPLEVTAGNTVSNIVANTKISNNTIQSLDLTEGSTDINNSGSYAILNKRKNNAIKPIITSYRTNKVTRRNKPNNRRMATKANVKISNIARKFNTRNKTAKNKK